MTYPSLFLKCRSIAFGLSVFSCFSWLVFLCIVCFIEWDVSGRTKRALFMVLFVANCITIITLPILIIRPFRPWLDGVRLLLLCMLHLAGALLFSYWGPKSPCPATDHGGFGRCEVFTLVNIIFAWIVSALLVAYSTGLSVMIYYRERSESARRARKSHQSSTVDLLAGADVEKGGLATPSSASCPSRSVSTTPTPQSITFPPEVVHKARASHQLNGLTPLYPNYHYRRSTQSVAHEGRFSHGPPQRTPGFLNQPPASRKSRLSFPAPSNIRTSVISQKRASSKLPSMPNTPTEKRRSAFMDASDPRFSAGTGRFRLSKVPRSSQGYY